MAVTKEQVLAALAKVPTPGGTALPDARVLSDIVATDGKVFFSISVDAAAVKAWEPVRKRAEEAVREIPGVQSALVALTAERAAGPPRACHRASRPGRAPDAAKAPWRCRA
jgi:ATP-binding protein involved in chromosome partitioning